MVPASDGLLSFIVSCAYVPLTCILHVVHGGSFHCLNVCLSISIHLSISLFVCLPLCLPIHPSIYLSSSLSVCLSIFLSFYPSTKIFEYFWHVKVPVFFFISRFYPSNNAILVACNLNHDACMKLTSRLCWPAWAGDSEMSTVETTKEMCFNKIRWIEIFDFY